MGKETELWDDSALISAFEQSLSKYKTFHSGKCNTKSTIIRDEISADTEADSSNTEQIQIISETMTETKEEIQQTLCSVEDETPQGTSMGQEKQPQPESSAGQEYAQLMSQYYELEEKRQKILQQIQLTGYYSYPTYPQSSYEPQAACSNPWPSVVNDGLKDQNVGKLPFHLMTGMAGNMRETRSAGINMEEQDMGKVGPGVEGAPGEVRIMETDLATVINSWYSAGFYTGRYLLEQSYKRSQ